jgi:signal transduction histidine kinase
MRTTNDLREPAAPAGDPPAAAAAALRDARLAGAARLAAAVAHDVNNALNPILAAAFLLERRADDPAAVREYARRIARAAGACADAVAGLGRFARQTPPAPGRDVPFDLASVAEQAVAAARARWAAAPAAPDVRPPEVRTAFAAGATARGVPDEVRAALVHLLQNAAEAMPGGGTVGVATGVTGDAAGGARAAWVEVRDGGVGMSAAVRELAFEPLFTTKRARGAGLGLAEVYAVMRRHGGRAELASAPGGGTVVRLCFPHAPGAGS